MKLQIRRLRDNPGPLILEDPRKSPYSPNALEIVGWFDGDLIWHN